MKFRKMIFVLTIATSIIFACMLGSTYAYYTLSNGTVVNVTTGVLDDGVSIVFTKSEFINLHTGIPISSSDVDSLASVTDFTITPDSSKLAGYDAAINIGFSNISIDSALKVSDFKYNVTCNDTIIGSGDGTSINGDSVNFGILSTSDGSFDISKTYNCSVRLWLQDSGVSQNELMNKKFSGYVKVSSVYRKQVVRMKKAKLIGAIIGVILFSLLVAGFTYAYLLSRVDKTLTTGSGKFSIDYQIVQNITSNSLTPSTDKGEGLHGIVKAKLSEGSTHGKFNIYITPSVIDGLNSEALKYEVYINDGGTITGTNGDFSSSTANESLTIVQSYDLVSTTDYVTFDIYIWLDNSLITNDMIGKSFKATINADSTAITGEF